MNKWFATPVAAIILGVSNLVPLAGVLFWDWDVASIVMLYWSENVILGAYTLVKMIARAPIGGWFAGLFFVVHYGGFCGIHGMLVRADPLQRVCGGRGAGSRPAFTALALSHGGRIAVAVAGHVGSPEARDGPLPSPA